MMFTLCAMAVVVLAFILGLNYGEEFVGLTIGAAILVAIVGFVVWYKADSAKNLPLEFYRKCIENDIQSMKSEVARQRAQLILESLGCTKKKNLEALFNKGYEMYLEKERAKRSEENEKQKEVEKEEARELRKYSELIGREKRIAMLTDLYEGCEEDAENSIRMYSALINSTQEKEIDWAVRGGMVSGIAGTAAGVSAALDAQVKNEKIRARNAANRAAFAPVGAQMVLAESNARSAARYYQEERQKAKLKLVDQKTSDKAALAMLDVKVTDITVTETGSARVEISVEPKQKLRIAGDIEAVVDGTIAAELSQKGKPIGRARFVLPIYGVNQKVTLKGMSTMNYDPEEKIDVTIKPYHLWLMEQ